MLKLLTLLIIAYAWAAPAENAAHSTKTAAVETQKNDVASDLNTDASSYYDRYSDFGSRSYPYGTSGYGGSGVTGYGSEVYTGGYGGSGLTGYGSGGYGTGGIAGYGSGGYGSGGGVTGYGTIDDRYNVGAGENYGYDRGYGSGGYAGYDSSRGGYGAGGASYGGYGGYGGNGGNGGINSYYGYNNPSYQGYGHTGYGYYNRRPGYGNIYNGGITPSLVTGYRGYSRK